ncbi:MAG: type II secretion system protein [Acidobacteria bacterium]|nr:type II secretion system protein [Acidobacteriota bacterium]
MDRLKLRKNAAVDEGVRARTKRRQLGYSLLELMIAMFIIIILISVAVPSYQKAMQNARETVLKENLWQMRRAIDQYSADKGKPPQTVDDLVTAKYLRERPTDPMTEKDEWREVMETDSTSETAEAGMTDVKSTSDGVDSEGKAYSEY